MRVLAIDFGEARIGLAISDPEGTLAVPLTTLTRTSDRDVIDQIAEIADREAVEQIVIGEPLNLDGTVGDAALRVRSFAKKLEVRLPLPCQRIDETLTSVEARERLQDAGVNPRDHPERIDAVAAQVLLEQFLATRAAPGSVDG